MSDGKPKRTREPVRSEPARQIAAAAATPAVSPPPIVREMPAVAPEPVATPPSAATEPAQTEPLAPPEPEAEPATADDPWLMFAEAQAALTRGFEEIAAEISGLTQSGVAATADAAIALLGARTFAEAIEINAGLARRGVDTLIEGTAKLSEIGVKAAADASRPILARLGSWTHVGAG